MVVSAQPCEGLSMLYFQGIFPEVSCLLITDTSYKGGSMIDQGYNLANNL